MATTELYSGYQIQWRETGEQFVALVRLPGEPDPPAVITATVAEGMAILKARAYQVIDNGLVDGHRPSL